MTYLYASRPWIKAQYRHTYIYLNSKCHQKNNTLFTDFVHVYRWFAYIVGVRVCISLVFSFPKFSSKGTENAQTCHCYACPQRNWFQKTLWWSDRMYIYFIAHQCRTNINMRNSGGRWLGWNVGRWPRGRPYLNRGQWIEQWGCSRWI